MKWVLRRTSEGGGFVAKSGCNGSYVRNLMNAKKYPTKEDALVDACIEEVPVNLEVLLDEMGR